MNAGNTPQPDRGGLPYALGAYGIWGLLPLYLILVQSVPAFEFVGWRIIWTVPICLLIIVARKQWAEVHAAFTNWNTLRILVLSSMLIAVNWFVYVWAIQGGHIYAASLGYYINPLINVMLGTALLGEKLTRRQWLAVLVAGSGVALLMIGALTTLWISLTLAFSFAAYGLLRKQVPVGSLPGLTVEAILMMPLAIGIAAWYGMTPAGTSFGQDVSLSLAIILGGFVTAIPLLLFAVAAKKMDYSTLGFVQFLAPTLVFFLGLLVFEEPLVWTELAAFVAIWTACALFVSDLWRKHPAKAASKAA